MVYGVMSQPLHKRFSFEQVVIVYVLFSAFLFSLARAKQLIAEHWNASETVSIAVNRVG